MWLNIVNAIKNIRDFIACEDFLSSELLNKESAPCTELVLSLFAS